MWVWRALILKQGGPLAAGRAKDRRPMIGAGFFPEPSTRIVIRTSHEYATSGIDARLRASEDCKRTQEATQSDTSPVNQFLVQHALLEEDVAKFLACRLASESVGCYVEDRFRMKGHVRRTWPRPSHIPVTWVGFLLSFSVTAARRKPRVRPQLSCCGPVSSCLRLSSAAGGYPFV